MNLVYAQSRVLSDVSEQVNCVFDFIAHLFAEHQLIKARASLEMICEELKGTHSFSKSILNLKKISDPIQAAINAKSPRNLCPLPISILFLPSRASPRLPLSVRALPNQGEPDTHRQEQDFEGLSSDATPLKMSSMSIYGGDE